MKTLFRPRTAGAGSLVVVLSMTWGGCPASTEPSAEYTYVDMSCDFVDASVPNDCIPPGDPPGANTACGTAPGQCPCSSTPGYLFCGDCPSASPETACRYCPTDSVCAADFCGDVVCVSPDQSTQVAVCPDDAPIDCGGSCCPYDFPTCCANKAYCGEDFDACADVDGSSSPDPGGCTFDCAAAGLTVAGLREGCCSDSGCLAACADTCGYSWYEANGQLFGPCSSDDQACMQTAAQAAVTACN